MYELEMSFSRIKRVIPAKAGIQYGGNMKSVPNKEGYFGLFGGKFVPETLMYALKELEDTYNKLKKDKKFLKEIDDLLTNYVGRPTPLYFAKRLTEYVGGAKIYLKREDLAHTGAHKINNTIGQALVAKRLGKKRIIAETGAGQHGVATATVCALLGLECEVFMGEKDMERQKLNVFRMEMLGAKVRSVTCGSKTLKDACNEAIRDWVSSVETTHYIIGSVIGPHPYPLIVRDFQAVIGREARAQILKETGKLPTHLVACVGGGSNSIGLFYPFFKDNVKFIGVEAGGLGINTSKHSAPLTKGIPGVLHGCYTYLMQDQDGQIQETHSISAGLDYPGVGPEHSFYKDDKRAIYTSVTDKEALKGFDILCKYEGIVPALESSHAIYYAVKLAKKLKKSDSILINLSGRGDKDVMTVYNIKGSKEQK